MSATTLDDRTFESATEPTPEEQLATAAHFEAKGYEVEIVPEGGASPAAPPVEPVPPVAVAPSADIAPPVDDQLDAESRADWQSATNDGEKLGKYAKRTKELHELRDKAKQLHDLKDKVSEKEAEIERLKTELANRTIASAPSGPALSPPASVVPEPPKPQQEAPAPITARSFEEPEPTEPTLAQFASEDDPHAAYAAAAVKYAKQLLAWDKKKSAFETAETNRVTTETRQRDEEVAEKAQRQQFIQTRFNEAVREHPDLVQKTSGINWPSTARYLLTEQLPNGFELGYELAKPENAQILAELIAKLPETTDPKIAYRQVTIEGPQALAVAEYRIKNRVPPVAAPPAAVTPPVPQPPPFIPEPRREEAAPLPNRASSVPAARPEDVPPMDSDARRALRGLPSSRQSVPHSQRTH